MKQILCTTLAPSFHTIAQEEMAEMKQKPHAIMIPFPLQGHVIPFVNLAIKLASNGFTITFINTEAIHHQISRAKGSHGTIQQDDIFAEARKSGGLDIRYTTVNDGFPLEFDRSLHHDKFLDGILHVFSNHVDELVGNLVLQDPTINTLITDTFYVWPSIVAGKYNLVNISFFTQPALVFSLYYHVELLKKNGHFAAIENRKDAIDYVPGVKSIMPTDLISYFQATDDISTPAHQIIQESFQDVRKSDFIICNTIEELEQETVLAIKKNHFFYSIGPIFPPGFTKSCISTSLWSESDCTQWLNTKPNDSVLYVSFGSYAHTSKHEIEEVANGLLLSEVSFIWVLRPDIVSSDVTDFLPNAFEDRIKGRGLVVSWCCQIEVISHPAVGGFLTHCGWNSILESIWCCLSMICYPLLTDQFTNRKLVVDDLKIGINLCDGKSMLSSEEVVEKITFLMKGKKSDGIRHQVKNVRKVLEDAMTMNGSSEINLNQFIQDLKAKIAKNKCYEIEEKGINPRENGLA